MTNQQLMQWAKAQLKGGWAMAALATLIYAIIGTVASWTYIVALIIAGPLYFGYYSYLNHQVDYKQSDLNLLFCGFTNRFAQNLVAGLLMTLAVGIGMVLLIVPGIILACGFSMTFLIMIDDPNITGVDALKASWNLMKGQKWNFFCLILRFIGWILLCIITFGILVLWIEPYMSTAQIGFYRQLRGQNATTF